MNRVMAVHGRRLKRQDEARRHRRFMVLAGLGSLLALTPLLALMAADMKDMLSLTAYTPTPSMMQVASRYFGAYAMSRR